jgi:hypothetical protein
MEEKAKTTSWSLAPCDKKQEVAVSLLSSLCTIGDNSWIDGLVVPTAKPRYVKGKVPTWHPKP